VDERDVLRGARDFGVPPLNSINLAKIGTIVCAPRSTLWRPKINESGEHEWKCAAGKPRG